MKRSTKFATVVASVLMSFCLAAPATADARKFSIDTLATVNIGDTMTHHQNTYEVTNLTNNFALTSYVVEVPISRISNLKATQAGRAVNAVAKGKQSKIGDLTFGAQEISINFGSQIGGLSRKWQFSLSFDTPDDLTNKGGVRIFYQPKVQFGENDSKYTLSVSAPKSFGGIHFSQIRPSFVDTDGTGQTAVYSRAEVERGSFEVSFGDAAIYQINFKFPLSNPNFIWSDLSVALPPELPTQHLQINSLDPKPASIKVDADGNIIATYKLSPRQKITVSTDITVAVKPLDYDTSLSGKAEDIPKQLIDQYTRPLRYWEADNADIRKAARDHYDPMKSVAENVRALYRYTIETLSYNQAKIVFNTREGALKTVQNPTNAVCMEYADFLIAHLRAMGIPARNVVGYAYSEGLKSSSSVADSLHSWVEVYIPDVGWMQIDPTWGEKIDNFGVSDVDHLGFAVYGVDSDSPQPITVGKRSLGYQYEQTELSYGEILPDRSSSTLKARHIPLPFLVLTNIMITNTGNTQITGLKLSNDLAKAWPAREINFAQTAPLEADPFYLISPLQKERRLRLTLSGVDSTGQTQIFSDSESELPFLVATFEGAILVGLPLLWVLYRGHRRFKLRAKINANQR